MAGAIKYPAPLVFGLDIGTRSIVGTVGYKIGEIFYVVAQEAREHQTRAMLDGQIHDIAKVGEMIEEVKAALELKIARPLEEVCIAAAGRVLKTEYALVSMDFEIETEITAEHIYELDSMGVKKAYEEFQKKNTTEEKFYCVGHTVVKYYMNGYPISNLENHRAREISMDLIATFLPEDVVDGLYKAVERAGLKVANLTLEPIAAIEVAIPEKYRMLNIALVDVGAGTSDICITNEGSISAYGMIPTAGDGLTERIAKHCLVEFAVAEQIKREISESDTVEYEDILGLPQVITKEEVLQILEPDVSSMTKDVAECIKKLNGGKSVSAVFVVGGGGKIEGYTAHLAQELGILVQRVALRGEEVMQKINFLDHTLQKDSLLVTPLGICLNFYEQNNNFIFVSLNDERMKLYDNGKLAVVDALMQSGISNDALFPKRGKELNFTVNGKPRIARGELGEACEVYLNGEAADLHTSIHANDIIRLIESTAGADAVLPISKLPEFSENILIQINGKSTKIPKFAMVNEELKPGSYLIKENDQIELLNYYTVSQVLSFIDETPKPGFAVYVNNLKAENDTKVYENFSFVMKKDLDEKELNSKKAISSKPRKKSDDKPTSSKISNEKRSLGRKKNEKSSTETLMNNNAAVNQMDSKATIAEKESQPVQPLLQPTSITVLVNSAPVTLSGKKEYVFVDVFDHIDFDLSKSNGRGIVTNLNGKQAQFLENLSAGDIIEIYWKE